MKILFIADIVGEPGRDAVKKKLPLLIENEKPDFVIANAENVAGGKGITRVLANDLFTCGINVITLGNHTFDRKEYTEIIEEERVIRPANYPGGVPGFGWNFYALENTKIAVINLMGRVYMPLIDCPFKKADEILSKLDKEIKVIFVDFHAEITSEKIMMGYYLDGRVSCVAGTHTHVQTADEKILEKGTAYITDAGMTGPSEGVIGMDKDVILKKYLTGINQHFVVAKGKTVLQGCIADIDIKTGRAKSIKRINISE